MPADRAPRDPLLAAARILLMVAMWVTLAGAVTSLLAVAVALVSPDTVLGWFARRGVGPPSLATVVPIAGVLVVIALLVFQAQRLLLRVIDSVALGDPFVPENARRLEGMAWLTVAIQLLSIVAGALAGSLAYLALLNQGPFGFSLGGVLLSLILFILARVFRRGAAMREELEGTV